jgi:hypothetical protein
MKSTLITAFFISGHLAISNCRAAESPSSESPVVATVLGKKITAADVGLQCDGNQKPLIPKPEEIDFTPYWKKPLPKEQE